MEDEKKLTQEEVNKLIAQAKSKGEEKGKEEAQKELEKTYKEKLETEIAKAIEKSKLTKDEASSYEEKEAKKALEAELERIKLENQELLTNAERAKRIENAKNTLKEKSIEPTERNIKLVLRDDDDKTLEAIDLLAETVAEQKKSLAQGTAPIESGGTDKKSDKEDIFKKAKITKF